MKKLAALAAVCLSLAGSTAEALAATPPSEGSGACEASHPAAWGRIARHRLVRLRGANPCPSRIVWISWSTDWVSDSNADVLIIRPGARFDWDAADLDDLARTMRFPVGADGYAVGVADLHYCFDTDGAAFEVTTAGVRQGSACPNR
jgi:hypothetical protein